MTNHEKLKEMTLEEAAAFLCDLIDEKYDDCEKCPVTELCSLGKNGFKVWLEREAKV